MSLQENVTDHAQSLGLHVDCGGDGSQNARIAFISEYPGETELQLKRPLVGNSGRYLWTELAKIGVKREQSYVTNVIKRRVISETVAGDKSLVPKDEMQKWQQVLSLELQQLPQLRYVVLLGNASMKAVTGHSGIKKWRGSVLQFTKEMGFATDGHLLVTYNPAFCIREPATEVHFKIDMLRLKRLLAGTWKPHLIAAHINPTVKQSIDYLRMLRSAKLPIATDIETIANETACVGFANNAHEGMCINFRDQESASRWSIHEEVNVREEIARTYADQQQRFVAQNGNFDSYWLRFKDRIRLPVWYDTLLAHHTLYPTLPHSLAFLTTQYTEHPYYKEEKDDWRNIGSMNGFWEYNVKDCCITQAVYLATTRELVEQKLDTFFFSHVMRLQPHLGEMTSNGILIDVAMREQVKTEMLLQLDVLEKTFKQSARLAASDPVLDCNPRSTPQLKKLFFNTLGLVGKGQSTNEDNRNTIRKHPNTSDVSKEMLDALDKYKEEHKFYSTYVDTAIDNDNRDRSEWRQFGTQSAPGRLSSAGVLWGVGGNKQNIPVRAKSMYVAPPGYGFVYFDLSQAEARYVAVAWNVKKLKENFAKQAIDPANYDIHRLNAATLFNVPYDQVPTADFIDNKPTIRYQGKRSVHGFNYRLMPETASVKFGITLAEATHAFRLYHRTFPEVSAEWRNITDRVKRDKVLFNCYGRRWILLSRIDDDDAMASIVAFEPQSSIGDKVCRIIYQSHDDIEWPRSRHGLEASVCLNVHDALVALARFGDMQRVASILSKHAAEPLIIRDQELVIPAEFGMSKPDEHGVHRWSTIEKVKL